MIILLICYGLIIYAIVEKDTKRRIIAGLSGAVGILVYPVIMELLLNLKALIFKSCETFESHSKKHKNTFQGVLPICYSEDYNITACGLENCHPFDSCKYRRSKSIY